MTKEEILAAAGYPNTPEGIAAFYEAYPNPGDWQQQMAYGGMPNIMGIPFGAGITMRDGGLTKYQGDVTGSQVPYINRFGKITEATNTLNFENEGEEEIRIPFKRDVDLEHRNIAMKLKELYSGSVGRGGDYNPEATKGTYTVAKEMYNDMNTNPQFDYKKYQNKVDSLYKVYPPMGYRDGGIPSYQGNIDGSQTGTINPLGFTTTTPTQTQIVNAGFEAQPDRMGVSMGGYLYNKETNRTIKELPGPPLENFKANGVQSAFDNASTTGTVGVNFNKVNTNNNKKSFPILGAKPNQILDANINKLVTQRYGGKPCYECGGSHMQAGGAMTPELAGQYPIFNYGGMDGYHTMPDGSMMSDADMNYANGGNKITQGGNQDFLTQYRDNFKNVIRQNVEKNMHEEESQKVSDAFYQAESQMPMPGMYQTGGGINYGASYYGSPNMENAALQDQYLQQMANFQNQDAQDRNNFRAGTVDFANNMLNAYRTADYTPQAQVGGTAQEQADWDAAMAQQEQEEARRTSAYAIEKKKAKNDYIESLRAQQRTVNTTNTNTNTTQQNLPWWQQMAQMYTPPGGRTNGLNYFPANVGSYYQMNKKGREAFNNLPANFQVGKAKGSLKYGPLGRTWLGKKMGIGPKRIDYELDGTSAWENSPYEQTPRIDLQDPSNPLHNPNQEDIQVMLDPSRNNNFGPEITTTPNPNVSWEFNKKAYGGGYYAQEGRTLIPEYTPKGVGTPITLGPTPKIASYSYLGAMPPYITPESGGIKPSGIAQFNMADEKGVDNIKAKASLERQVKGVGRAVGQYAVPFMDKLSSMLEGRQNAKTQQRYQDTLLANNAFQSTPLNAKNRGDYDVNSGMLRPDDYVPVQFPGSVARYGGGYMQDGGYYTDQDYFQTGGMYNEGEELDLSDDEIAELEAQGYIIERQQYGKSKNS